MCLLDKNTYTSGQKYTLAKHVIKIAPYSECNIGLHLHKISIVKIIICCYHLPRAFELIFSELTYPINY